LFALDRFYLKQARAGEAYVARAAGGACFRQRCAFGIVPKLAETAVRGVHRGFSAARCAFHNERLAGEDERGAADAVLLRDFAEEERKRLFVHGSERAGRKGDAGDYRKAVRLSALLANLSYRAGQAILVHPL
jgi:hypothetical protein